MAVLYPQRIVCLTEESTEILYLLGEQARIVGISGYTVRPPQARREKAKVSRYIDADLDSIVALQPDLVLGFSDMQADIARSLIARGLQVLIFNQRSIEQILAMVAQLAALIGCQQAGEALVQRLRAGLTPRLPQRRPRVFFEEWPKPLISGSRWVSELIEIAGGDDIFPELRTCGLGRERVVDPQQVLQRRPDIIIGSWCGKKVKPEMIAARPGWQGLAAVQSGRIHSIKSAVILQPGPAALTDGLQALQAILDAE